MAKSRDPYAEAMKRASRTVWPGCIDGRCRPCGGLHNFSYVDSAGQAHDNVRCRINYQLGCPQPHPEPVHQWVGHRCSRCGRSAGWVALDGRIFSTISHAKANGLKRAQLRRESDPKPAEASVDL
jgi:hypothetical protein